MNSEKAQNIVKCGVMPGEIDSIDLAEAKGYLQGRKDFAKELLDSLDTVDPSFLPNEYGKSIVSIMEAFKVFIREHREMKK